MHVMALEEIVTAYASLGEFERAFEYQKQLLALKLTVQKLQMDRDLSRVTMRYEVEKKEAEKEAYRVRALQLETEVTRLGLEVINRNDFLVSLKHNVQKLIPMSNGSERSLRSFVKEIDEAIAAGEAQQQFNTALDQLHANFRDTLAAKYPHLTNTEKKVCSLIKLGLNSQQIGNLLFSSPRTVEVHRLRIRKKIEVPANTDLMTFLNSLT
jgi:DNA-binding CsgD family transcriptional regulator